jgi:hypothetical protein
MVAMTENIPLDETIHKGDSMTDDLITRINAAMDGVTKGEWGWNDLHNLLEAFDGEDWHIVIDYIEPRTPSNADAALIAAAPSLLREARDEITRLQGELDEFNKVKEWFIADGHELPDKDLGNYVINEIESFIDQMAGG